VPRDVKIDRMKRIISYRNACKEFTGVPFTLKEKDDHSDEDEEEQESCLEYWTCWINCCVLMCLDRFGLVLREIELLERGGDSEDLSHEIISAPVNGGSRTTKIEKPFKLVRDRKSIGASVFQHGHNLPTMTIDEYLDLERKRGNIIEGGGPASANKSEFDEDAEEYLEAELLKDRERDELKDSNF
jgi:hypothetical protein